MFVSDVTRLNLTGDAKTFLFFGCKRERLGRQSKISSLGDGIKFTFMKTDSVSLLLAL